MIQAAMEVSTVEEAPLFLDGVSKRYGRRLALRSITLQLTPARIVGVVGPNGAGKTTLLGIALGILQPTSGTVTRKSTRIGAVLERDGLLPGPSAEATLRQWAPLVRANPERVVEVLTEVGLQDVSTQRVGTFSQGMRRRLALARALLGHPEVLILDEPGNGLDPSGLIALHTLLRKEAAAGAAIVLSSHAIGEVDELCDDIVFLEGGEVVERWDRKASRWWRCTVPSSQVAKAAEVLGESAVPDVGEDSVLVRQDVPLLDVLHRLEAAGIETNSVTDLGRDLQRPFRSADRGWGR